MYRPWLLSRDVFSGFCQSGEEQGLLQEVPGQIQEEER